jgi:hypothetical protein
MNAKAYFSCSPEMCASYLIRMQGIMDVKSEVSINHEQAPFRLNAI